MFFVVFSLTLSPPSSLVLFFLFFSRFLETRGELFPNLQEVHFFLISLKKLLPNTPSLELFSKLQLESSTPPPPFPPPPGIPFNPPFLFSFLFFYRLPIFNLESIDLQVFWGVNRPHGCPGPSLPPMCLLFFPLLQLGYPSISFSHLPHPFFVVFFEWNLTP